MANVPNLAPAAFKFQGSPFAFAVYGPVRDRLSQVLNSELSLDEAIAKMQEDIDAKLKESGN
ncbi:MAG: hypothetical protein R2880_04325 [Deinococcales bacterium]